LLHPYRRGRLLQPVTTTVLPALQSTESELRGLQKRTPALTQRHDLLERDKEFLTQQVASLEQQLSLAVCRVYFAQARHARPPAWTTYTSRHRPPAHVSITSSPTTLALLVDVGTAQGGGA